MEERFCYRGPTIRLGDRVQLADDSVADTGIVMGFTRDRVQVKWDSCGEIYNERPSNLAKRTY